MPAYKHKIAAEAFVHRTRRRLKGPSVTIYEETRCDCSGRMCLAVLFNIGSDSFFSELWLPSLAAEVRHVLLSEVEAVAALAPCGHFFCSVCGTCLHSAILCHAHVVLGMAAFNHVRACTRTECLSYAFCP